MKRFELVLVLLGLMAVFSTSAFAVDLKFKGEYYAAGLYLDKTTVKKDMGPSTAFYFQRLRLTTDLIVSKGLVLTTRADIMERAWGAARSAPGSTQQTAVGTNTAVSSGTQAENENIGFDYCYLSYYSPLGRFRVGIQQDTVWGTEFGDDEKPGAGIGYLFTKNGFGVNLKLNKNVERSSTAIAPVAFTDGDNNAGSAALFYIWKGGEAGVLWKHFRYSQYRPATGMRIIYNLISPYAKINLGPVFLQTQLYYLPGERYYDDETKPAVKENPLSFWVDGTVNLGMFYGGGTFAYVSGDDPGTTERIEGGTLTGGLDWSPCLIMFNYDRTNWAGQLTGYTSGTKTANQNNPMINTYFFQLRGGIRPVDNLDIMAAVSYATADKKPTAAWLYNDYGYEVDLTATYKITNNLSYMIGAGYLFTGKYYKADKDTNELSNDYMVTHRLTLTF
ncbi:MAG: hypothetical protein K4571_07670 [Deltaproteobacteria bacterium]